MKIILSAILTVLVSTTLLAGEFDPYRVDPKFEKELAPLLSTVDSVGAIAYAAILPNVKQISAKYPREWRGYYWEAMANLRKAEIDSTGQKDVILDEVERLIDRAEMFIKENPELYLLRAWMLKQRIDIAPATRQAKYGTDYKWYMDQVYKLDQGNPRYYYLKGLWSEGDTSEAGKKITLRYYKSARLLFQDRPQGRYISEPDWGRGETDLALGVLMPPTFNTDDPTGELAGAIADSLRQAEKNTPKEVLKEEKVPKEMIGAELPESLLNPDQGVIKVTDKGAVYSSRKFGGAGTEKRKKDEAPEAKSEKKDKKDKSDKKDKKSKEDEKSEISIGKTGDKAAAGDKDSKSDKKDKKDKSSKDDKSKNEKDSKKKKSTPK
ncbi:MAG: hypothetical protein V4616_02120 [Bacteroidota bacterium]